MRTVLVILAGLISGAAANAAQVCTGISGTYGSVTLTKSGTCSDFGAFDGLQNTSIISSANTCSFAFSPAVSTAQLTAKLSNVDDFDQVGFNLNGASYSLVPADVDTVSTPPTSAGSLAIIGNQVTSPTNGVSGAGTISFSNSSPALTTSIDFVKTGTGGVAAVVCFDDAAIVATSVASVPTLSEWSMIFMASLIAMFGMRMMRRK